MDLREENLAGQWYTTSVGVRKNPARVRGHVRVFLSIMHKKTGVARMVLLQSLPKKL